MPSDSYPYAIGRIKGLERGLLSSQDFGRVAEQPLQAAVKQLADSGYGQNAEDKSDPDSLVAAELKSLRFLIDELTPEKPLTDLFWLEQDAINLKLLLKARFLGEELDETDFAYGLFEPLLLRDAVARKNYAALPDPLRKELAALEIQIAKNSHTGLTGSFEISTAVDKAIYSHIFFHGKNDFVREFFAAKVDFTNVLSFLRARSLNWASEDFSLTLLPGGELPHCRLLACYTLPSGDVEIELPRSISRSAIIRQGLVAAFMEGGDTAAASDLFSRAMLELSASERFDPFGIGPIVYYLYRKMDEGKQLRVLFAKKRSFDPD